MVHQVDMVVDFFRTMQGHNSMVQGCRIPCGACLAGDVVATGEVVAVRDKHRSVGGHDEETGAGCKWRLSNVHPYIPGNCR